MVKIAKSARDANNAEIIRVCKKKAKQANCPNDQKS